MGTAVLASYEDWSRVIGGILRVVGVEGFLQDRDEVKAALADADEPLNNFIRLWFARFQSADVTIGSLSYDATPSTKPPTDLVSLLLNHKGEIDLGFNNYKLPSWQSELGKRLRGAKDRVFDVSDGQTTIPVKLRHRKTNKGIRYRLEPTETSPPDHPNGEATEPPTSAPAPQPETRARGTTACTYENVVTRQALSEWVEAIRATDIVAVDIETTGLDVMTDKLVGVSLAIENRACYVPLGHTTGEAQLPQEVVLASLKPILEDPAVTKVLHNAKFDAHILGRYGIRLEGFEDTMLMSYALDSGAVDSHGLKELALRHFEHNQTTYQEVVGNGHKKKSFAEVPIADATAYAAQDADVALRLYRLLKPRLEAEGVFGTYHLDRALVPVLIDMERAGIAIDRDALKQIGDECGKEMAGLEAEVRDLAGEPFNLGSSKQVAVVLFDKLGLPVRRRTKTGAPAVDSDALEELSAESPLARAVLAWRKAQKIKTAFADKLPEHINAATGRVHTSFNPIGAKTGRLSSSEPNLQQIRSREERGRLMRGAFVAAPGNVLLAADYSQIELRILAHMSKDRGLIAAFRSGHDFHTATASQVFNQSLEEVTKEQRGRAKAINFGIVYGMTAFGLARQIGVTAEEAQGIIDAYFGAYPGVQAYMEKMREAAARDGAVWTLFGRRVHVPDMSTNRARNLAVNAPIQGSAADLIRRAMVRMPEALAEAGLKARMLLTVHDELVFELPRSEVEAASPLIRRDMEAAGAPHIEFSVPIVAEVKTGPIWADAH